MTDDADLRTRHRHSLASERNLRETNRTCTRIGSQARVAATRKSTQFRGLDQLGTVSAGKSADFAVLDANPPADITNTGKIARVSLRGTEWTTLN